MNKIKNFNWKGAAITAVVAIVAVKILYPIAQPYLAKIPVAGRFFVA